MTTKRQVIDTHLKHHDWGPSEIADHLHCCSGYVRATAQRCNLKLPRSANKPRNPENLVALGRAARAAGLSLADIKDIADTINA